MIPAASTSKAVMVKLSFLPHLVMLGFFTTFPNGAPAQEKTVAPTNARKLGNFAIINLAGWTQQQSFDNSSDVVFYYQTTDTSQITLTFGWVKGVDDGKERIARYRSLIKQGKSMFTPSSRPNTRYKVVAEQLFTLNGIPAVMHKTLLKTSDRTQIEETVQFAYNNKFYTLTRGIAFMPPKAEPQLQAALNQGWSTLSKSIKASK